MKRLRGAWVWTAVEEEEEGEGKKDRDKGVHVGRDKSACQTLRSLLTEISVAATRGGGDSPPTEPQCRRHFRRLFCRCMMHIYVFLFNYGHF